MTNQTSGSNSLALASRFLNAWQNLFKTLNSNVGQGMDHLNLSQVRIMQIVHDTPGIRADTILDQLDLDPNQGAEFMLDLERYGLLSLNRSTPNVAPTVTLGAQGQRLAFQIKATQLVTITELFSKLPENDQLTAVTMLEQVAAQQAD